MPDAKPCETCKKIAALVKRERRLRSGEFGTQIENHGRACDAVWDALYRLADNCPDVAPAVATDMEKVAKKERTAVVKEIKKMLPALVDAALEEMEPTDV